jgi:CheY-like chemotaxis protein
MTDTTTLEKEPVSWKLLFVDDEEDVCREVQEYLEGEVVADPDEHPKVETLTDFGGALESLEARRFDLLILDVRLGPRDVAREDEVGIMTLDAIRQRRFVPVVFYTGLPHLVQNLETPLIRVVEKTQGLPHLLGAVKEIFATRLPAVNRALLRHLEKVQRDYMWEFVATHWEQFGASTDRTALAYLLARRLAMSLSGPGIRQLAHDLGDPHGTVTAEGLVHPMRYYVMPPVQPAPIAGDLYRGQIGDQDGYWVLLTPSCDLVTGREKAEWVLLAKCLRLTAQVEYQKWAAGLPKPSKTAKDRLKDLLQNNRRNSQPERFYLLPSALTLPNLVVDFQQLMVLAREQIGSLERLASIDSPFAEALLARFARYFGRLGTPDLDVEAVLSSLEAMAGEGVG